MASKSSAEKKQKEEWIRDQIEYKNPNLPWNQPTKVKFPPPDEKDKEFMRTHDRYGNPYTPEQLAENEKHDKEREEEAERLKANFTPQEDPISYGKRDLYGNPIKEDVKLGEVFEPKAINWGDITTPEQQEKFNKWLFERRWLKNLEEGL